MAAGSIAGVEPDVGGDELGTGCPQPVEQPYQFDEGPRRRAQPGDVQRVGVARGDPAQRVAESAALTLRLVDDEGDDLESGGHRLGIEHKLPGRP